MRKLICLILFLVMFMNADCQTIDEYTNALIPDASQTWVLDSIKLLGPSRMKKGTTLKFEKNSSAVRIKAPSENTKTLDWSLQPEKKYMVLEISNFGHYEIDFIQNANKKSFLRLRDKIHGQKNLDVTEYYFLKSN